MNFPVFFIWFLNSCHIVEEVILYMYLFKSTKTCFMSYVLCLNMWSFLENVLCVLENNVYSFLLGWVFCKRWLGLVGLLCCSSFFYFLTHLLPTLSTHYGKWCIKVFNCYCTTISPYNSVNVCFIKCLLGMSMFIGVMSSFCIDTLLI